MKQLILLIFLLFSLPDANSQLYDYYLNKGKSYAEVKNYSQAVFYYNKAIDNSPNKSLGYFMKGSAEYYLLNFEQALIHLNKAISIDPQYPVPYKCRGMIYEELNKNQFTNDEYDSLTLDEYNQLEFVDYNQLALNDYNQYLKTHDDDLFIMSSKCWLLIKLDKNDEAKILIEQILIIDSNHIETINVLGLYYEDRKNYDKAIESFSRIIEIDSMNATAYYNRCRNNAFLENMAENCSDCKRAIELGIEGAELFVLKANNCK